MLRNGYRRRFRALAPPAIGAIVAVGAVAHAQGPTVEVTQPATRLGSPVQVAPTPPPPTTVPGPRPPRPTTTTTPPGGPGPWPTTTTTPPGGTGPGGTTTIPPPPGGTGSRAPRGDIGVWRQAFVDDFDTDIPLGSFPTSVSSTWSAYGPDWTDTSKRGRYSPDRVVSVSNGVLRKYLHTEAGFPRVAAITPKVPGAQELGTMYGRYEVRARFDRLPGYKVAWLLWPVSGVWPRDGEIDWPEADLDEDRIMGFVHYQGATVGSDQAWARVDAAMTEWHTYTIEWSPNLVVFRFDGSEVLRVTERVPNTPMRWVIQTETSLSAAPSPDVAGYVEIDWVSVWTYNP